MARIFSSSVFAPTVSSRAFVAMASSGAACGSAKSVYHLDTSDQLSKLLTAGAGEPGGGPDLTAGDPASERPLRLARPPPEARGVSLPPPEGVAASTGARVGPVA